MLSRLFYLDDRHRTAAPKFLAACLIALSVWLLPACNKPLPYPPIKPLSRLIVLIPEGPLDYEPPTHPQKLASGFSHDLVTGFAASQTLEPQFVVTPTGAIPKQLREHTAHMAVGWIHGDGSEDIIRGPMIAETHDILVHNQTSNPVREFKSLQGKTIRFLKGSHTDYFLTNPAFATERESLAGINFQPFDSGNLLEMLEKVASQEIEYAIVDKASFSIALNYFPTLDNSLKLGKPYPISWLFPPGTSPLLIQQVKEFILDSRQRGDINRLLDRYLGHVKRLSQNDKTVFIERIRTLLPEFKAHFTAAQEATGLDWRLLAALAYQESGWDPLATSQTNVRGIMMLTEETASRIGVKDRLDARQSIIGGSRYLQMLRRKIAPTTPEPDRTWQALAAYNLGLTNFYLARQFARKNNLNPDSWYDMKKALPRFARVSHARGGEAVIMVESIRALYDSLKRHEAPHIPKHPKGKQGRH